MITSGATLNISQTDRVFFANYLYTLEFCNTQSTLCIAVGFVSHTGDLRTSEQQLILFQTSYPASISVRFL
jgi:hypothetical protein